MKKYLSVLLIILFISTSTIFASDVNIINKVYEQEYTYWLEYLDFSGNRIVVDSNFCLPDGLTLNSTKSKMTTNPFFIKRSSGNEKSLNKIIVKVIPDNYANLKGEVQPFYPSVKLYKKDCRYSDSTYFGVSKIGYNDNGLIFGINIPAEVHENPEDIGAFYMYYDPSVVNLKDYKAGYYTSKVKITIMSDL